MLKLKFFPTLLAAAAAVFASAAGATETLSASAGESTASAGTPNIIVIVSDDHGYADLGVAGAKDLQTPNLDSLAANGIRFTQGYVTCPVCSPTRAALMTGKYQQRFGHEFNPGPDGAAHFGLPTDQKTIANYLKEAGYVTGAVGKWHLGMREECRPLRRGFDSYYGFLGGAHGYTPRAREGGDNVVRRGDMPVSEPRYLTSAFTDEACSFVEQNKTKPFFLYLAYNAIHTPMEAAPEHQEQFKLIQDPKRRTMASMLAALDAGVGKVLQTLRANNLEENTLIVFHADNGGPTQANASSNKPLRGFKGDTLEGGIRVPFMVQWKGRLPKGVTYTNPVITLDILPTVLAAVGREAGADANLDGMNLLPLLAESSTSAPERQLFWRFGPQYAVRSGDYKLVKTREDGPRLYNLAADIAEQNDLTSSSPEVVAQLQKAYDDWNSRNIPPRWTNSRMAKAAANAAPQAAGTVAEEQPTKPRAKAAAGADNGKKRKKDKPDRQKRRQAKRAGRDQIDTDTSQTVQQ